MWNRAKYQAAIYRQGRIVELNWDYPSPFIVNETVSAGDIDILGHANNTVYLRWLEQAAWQHSIHLGLDMAVYEAEQRAMVVHRHELDYSCACYQGEAVSIGTWLVACDNRMRLWRRYQVIKTDSGITCLRGLTRFVCADFKSGRPKRMPESFIKGYQPTIANPEIQLGD